MGGGLFWRLAQSRVCTFEAGCARFGLMTCFDVQQDGTTVVVPPGVGRKLTAPETPTYPGNARIPGGPVFPHLSREPWFGLGLQLGHDSGHSLG